MKPILGIKAIFLRITGGVSQFLLDFSLHGEERKRSDKPQGLSKKKAEALNCDTMILTEQAISNDKQIKAVKQN